MTQSSHSVYDKEKGKLFGCLASGEDLLAGLIAQCEVHGITSGFVTCMGSLSQVCYIHGASDAQGKPTYSQEKEVVGAIELLSGTGVIAKDESGELDIHFHGLIVNEDGTILGGHFLKNKNPVLVTIEFCIHVSDNVEAKRAFNEKAGFRLTTFNQK
ncbi:PPC domain-containing DNA-binding protein [Bacillus sp. FJAT-45350]|uniref:PPC domain-containing DNA-binding protein n=1 Tax=Bacillus sp. FJAT-45350 TaxID=2011014 RepID=UPI0015C7B5BC|nr:PPC domain-containing DNA-binding protein [Bacillus sp. FJAT-45350]